MDIVGDVRMYGEWNFTLVGTFVNFWSKASEMLCAGSVEMINTDSRTLASCMAKLQLHYRPTPAGKMK